MWSLEEKKKGGGGGGSASLFLPRGISKGGRSRGKKKGRQVWEEPSSHRKRGGGRALKAKIVSEKNTVWEKESFAILLDARGGNIRWQLYDRRPGPRKGKPGCRTEDRAGCCRRSLPTQRRVRERSLRRRGEALLLPPGEDRKGEVPLLHGKSADKRKHLKKKEPIVSAKREWRGIGFAQEGLLLPNGGGGSQKGKTAVQEKPRH